MKLWFSTLQNLAQKCICRIQQFSALPEQSSTNIDWFGARKEEEETW
jgi:hypothetical protein